MTVIHTEMLDNKFIYSNTFILMYIYVYICIICIYICIYIYIYIYIYIFDKDFLTEGLAKVSVFCLA